MFGVIKDMGARILAINQDEILKDIFDEPSIQAQIIDLNQNQLYEKGVQSDGEPTGDYAPITVSKYKPLAAAEGRDGRSDHITGKDAGITYDSMKVNNEMKSFTITADDRNNFFDREPKGLGLTQESINEIIPEVRELFIEKVREKIFG